MPTGYTEKVRTGEMTSFKDFAYRCTRAMGVAVLQRDESLDVPLQEEFVPDTSYYEKWLSDGYTDLIKALAWTPEEADAAARASYDEAAQHEAEYKAKCDADVARYEAMLEKVQAWTPPTDEHVGLKKFMVSQLEESIKFDGYSGYSKPVLKTGEEYRVAAIQSAQRAIARASEQIEKEITRAEERKTWVEEFKKSVENY